MSKITELKRRSKFEACLINEKTRTQNENHPLGPELKQLAIALLETNIRRTQDPTLYHPDYWFTSSKGNFVPWKVAD